MQMVPAQKALHLALLLCLARAIAGADPRSATPLSRAPCAVRRLAIQREHLERRALELQRQEQDIASSSSHIWGISSSRQMFKIYGRPQTP